jgi:hypothetical protein
MSRDGPSHPREDCMSTNRREFIERLGATAMVGALPFTAIGATELLAQPAQAAPSSDAWDFRWIDALKGKKHRALFDATEVESGYPLWRANFWEPQYQAAFGTKPEESITVLVLRHNAILLGFNQDYWNANKLGAVDHVTHPITQQSTDLNPALLSSARNEVPAQFDAFALPNFIARGGIVLACNIALGFHAGAMAKKNGITEEEALKRAKAALLPGVTLMPSGVFSCVKAQEEGCVYVKGSA